MGRYIDAELLEPDTEWDDYEDGYMSYSDLQIRYAKTADVRENVKGHWVADRYCSVCDFDKYEIDCCCGMPQNFCPNCGADMRGKKHE